MYTVEKQRKGEVFTNKEMVDERWRGGIYLMHKRKCARKLERKDEYGLQCIEITKSKLAGFLRIVHGIYNTADSFVSSATFICFGICYTLLFRVPVSIPSSSMLDHAGEPFLLAPYGIPSSRLFICFSIVIACH